MIHKLYICYVVMTITVYEILKLSVFFCVTNKKMILKKQNNKKNRTGRLCLIAVLVKTQYGNSHKYSVRK